MRSPGSRPLSPSPCSAGETFVCQPAPALENVWRLTLLLSSFRRYPPHLLALVLIFAPRLSATSHTWLGTIDGAWSKAANWSGGVPTVGEAQPVDLTFPVGAMTYLLNNDVSGLTVHNIAISDNGYSIGGTAITLSGDVIVDAVASSNAIDLGLTLTAGNHNLTLVDATSIWGLSGVIGGTGDITKAGAGFLTLSGTNTYSGTTTVSQGILDVANQWALGSTSAGTIVLGGASLQVDIVLNTAEPLILSGSGLGTGALLFTSSGISSFYGPVVLNAPGVTVGVGANTYLEFTGGVSGTGGLTKAGAGSLYFEGDPVANTFAGITTIQGGLVQDFGMSPGPAIPGDLVLNGGDFAGTKNSFATTSNVSVNVGRYVRLFGSGSETIASLTLVGGGVQVDSGNTVIVNGPINSNAAAQASTITGSGSGSIGLGGATRTITVADGPPVQDLVISAGITGAAVGIVKAGPGTMVMSGANQYSGPTLVNAGTLLVNGMTQFSNVTVNNGGNLGGTGTVRQLIAVSGGIVSPGASTGILSANFNSSLGVGSTLFVQLNGTTAGTQYDRLAVSGTLALAGNLSVTVGYAPTVGDTFTIVQSTGALTGTFAGLSEAAVFCVGSVALRVNYTASTATLTVVADTTAPDVAPPSALTTTQTVCM